MEDSRQEVPPDVRAISVALLHRLSSWMGFDLGVNSVELHLRFHNGRLEWVAPQPRISAKRVDEPAEPPSE